MPDAPGLELLLAEINQTTPGAVIDTSFDREQATLIVDPEHVLAVLTWLRDTPGQEYKFLSSVHGVDYLPAQPRFAVHYELLNRERYERLRVKAVLNDPAIATPTPVGAGPEVTATPPHELPESEAASDMGPVGAPDGGRPNGSISDAAPTSRDTEDGLPHIASCVDLFPTAEFQEREVYDFFGIVFEGHPDLRRILMPEDYVGWPQRRDFPVGGEPVIFTRDERTNPGWYQ